MNIVLKPGEHIAVQFHETDGEFEVHFDTHVRPNQIAVLETAGLDGNEIGIGGAILYKDSFRPAIEDDEEAADDAEDLREHSREIDVGYEHKYPDAPSVGFFMDADNRIHCTAFVLCNVVPDALNKSWRVETYDSADSVTGSYDFYSTLEELEATSGLKADRKVI